MLSVSRYSLLCGSSSSRPSPPLLFSAAALFCKKECGPNCCLLRCSAVRPSFMRSAGDKGRVCSTLWESRALLSSCSTRFASAATCVKKGKKEEEEEIILTGTPQDDAQLKSRPTQDKPKEKKKKKKEKSLAPTDPIASDSPTTGTAASQPNAVEEKGDLSSPPTASESSRDGGDPVKKRKKKSKETVEGSTGTAKKDSSPSSSGATPAQDSTDSADSTPKKRKEEEGSAPTESTPQRGGMRERRFFKTRDIHRILLEMRHRRAGTEGAEEGEEFAQGSPPEGEDGMFQFAPKAPEHERLKRKPPPRQKREGGGYGRGGGYRNYNNNNNNEGYRNNNYNNNYNNNRYNNRDRQGGYDRSSSKRQDGWGNERDDADEEEFHRKSNYHSNNNNNRYNNRSGGNYRRGNEEGGYNNRGYNSYRADKNEEAED